MGSWAPGLLGSWAPGLQRFKFAPGLQGAKWWLLLFVVLCTRYCRYQIIMFKYMRRLRLLLLTSIATSIALLLIPIIMKPSSTRIRFEMGLCPLKRQF